MNEALRTGARIMIATALIATIATGGPAARAAETLRYSVIAGGEKVGFLEAVIDGRAIEIEYVVRNNGRGPTISERIELNRKGVPLRWTIQGKTAFGGAVDELYEWRDGRARWRSQADAGEIKTSAPALYVANDASPWSAGLYANALLESGARELATLPGGALRLEELGREWLGEGLAAIRVRLFALSGVDLHPAFIMIDDAGRLAAELGARSMVVREGFEDQHERLAELFETLTRARAADLQQRLARRFMGPVRYVNARVFDPKSGAIKGPAAIVVHGEKITVVDYEGGLGAPGPDETVIDAEGGVLVPGLHDMHSHTSLWSGLFYLAAGVTTTRDQGNDQERLLDIIGRTEAGALAGPRIIPNGMIEGRSEHSVRVGVIADSLQAALDAVRRYAAHGYFQIKIYNSIKPEWVKPIAAEAKRLGLGVTGHVPAFMSPDEAILAGYDDIAHVNQLMLGWLIREGEDTRTPLRLTAMRRAASLDLDSAPVRRTIALMKQHGVALDTTAVILERLLLSRAGEVSEADAPYLDHMPIGYQRYRKRSFVSLDEPDVDAEYRRAFAALLDTLALLNENGVQLLPGTDDGSGVSVHREIELYVKAGLSNAEALRLATLACDEYLGRDQAFGSIEKGKYADFFLIQADPLADISAIRQVRLVSRGGMVYFPSEIYEALAIRPFASPPPVAWP
ncbi:amidohydrolase family protein [Amphiplicatus metriothermophilus]|uniref:Imidazolonepropionase n=1 Tax=Amphiplicatus metriothermophilus TaxID=1519374 RepID=A0A239PW10_9PROT|nr:amidohydrolase family protein [Amphiplicatus metriothermophilus]MBB5519568.1 imidazolonepropionase-like amidohydrolase [Amphiplicatus metriothermophilus]SNT74132.1 Imidazolonepropionase [Amphiplicatus metriothermophilus]